MKDENIQTNNEIIVDDVAVPAVVDDIALPPISEEVATVVPVAPASALVRGKITPGRRMRDSARKGTGRTADAPKGGRSREGGRGGEGRERVKPEFDSKTIDIRRVTRVAAGGRRFTFSVAAVVGDHKGRVGVGLGKGSDTALSVEKAVREAKKHLVKIPLSAQMVIPHAVEGKFGSAVIKIFPARGSGVVAGSSARAVIELAGIKDICAKIMSGSKNKVNIARATIVALGNLSKISKATLRGRTDQK